jgi:hypothetical protein
MVPASARGLMRAVKSKWATGGRITSVNVGSAARSSRAGSANENNRGGLGPAFWSTIPLDRYFENVDLLRS